MHISARVSRNMQLMYQPLVSLNRAVKVTKIQGFQMLLILSPEKYIPHTRLTTFGHFRDKWIGRGGPIS
jgi:predicted RNA polymerase sigma factor